MFWGAGGSELSRSFVGWSHRASLGGEGGRPSGQDSSEFIPQASKKARKRASVSVTLLLLSADPHQ